MDFIQLTVLAYGKVKDPCFSSNVSNLALFANNSGQLNPAHEDTTIFRNFGNYLRIYKAQHSRRLEYSGNYLAYSKLFLITLCTDDIKLITDKKCVQLKIAIWEVTPYSLVVKSYQHLS